jgi:threonine dehydrogenase-like Zn-dependent dehydrogenase
MKAAVLRGLRDIVCEEMPDPVPGRGEVVVRVRYCGICGSDVHGYREGLFSPGTVMGHEFAGDVVDVDSLVTSVVPLSNIREAFEEHVKAENSIKVLLEP